jgi:hypothetical protein
MQDTAADVMVTQPLAALDNYTLWTNLTVWTSQRLGYNISKLTPSIEDLLKAGPRMVMKLGRLGGSLMSFPDAVDDFGQRAIPEATDGSIFHTTGTTAGSLYAETTAPGTLPSLAADQDPNAFLTRITDGRGLGSIFSYATSKWALSCVVMAVVLNRTMIFAATRRRVRLLWRVRLALRIVPVVLLLLQCRQILRSIQCQTSPDFAELRWGNASKSSELMFSHYDSYLHTLSSTLLLGASDEESCVAVQMTPAPGEESASNLRGSLSRLWPLFGTVCLSRFVETLSCSLQGRPVASETVMTLFEHSLAFAEADAAIGNQLGWGLFANSTNGKITLGNNIAVTRSMIMNRVNTSPEVLLVGFFSAAGHLTSHILAIFNVQAKVRLLNTAFFALSFMGSMVWSGLHFSLDDPSSQSLLRYPTVVIVGFIPHLLIVGGILVCFTVYSLALLVSAAASPSVSADGQRLSFKERLALAHGNMQANISLKSDIRIRMDMDFFTALLRAGFAAITMASEAVYLNEDSQVNLKPHTWLEEERLRELEQRQRQWIADIPGSSSYFGGIIGLVPVKDGHAGSSSGYAREKAAQELRKKGATDGRRVTAGVGAAERTSRWLMAMEYVMFINRFLITVWALVTLRFLAFFGVRNPPRLIRWFAQRPKANQSTVKKVVRRERPLPYTDYIATPDGDGRYIPRSERTDVEAEVRRWFGSDDNPNRRLPVAEDAVDSMLYSWWAKGGWWGNTDSSSDYLPPPHLDDDGIEDPDFDATSVVSTSDTNDDYSGWEDDDNWNDEPEDDGQRTPTQQSPYRGMTPNRFASRESTPVVDNPLDPADLARLLHPTSAEEREEARALAAHLGSDRILTRSSYRRLQAQQRIQILGGSRLIPANKMTPEEEATVLEQILLSRRAAASAKNSVEEGGGDDSWATGAAGLGPDGPQCVVCQSAARTIIVWPCRCLSLCDDCRVSLAMNNFDKCVCCRREVASFSRIFVP